MDIIQRKKEIEIIIKILDKDTKEIANFFDISLDVVEEYKYNLSNGKKSIENELNKYKSQDSNASLFYKRNLRHTIGDKMVDIFGKYQKEDEKKMAEIIGISYEALSNLIHNGYIYLNDFIIVCDYLKPSELLKKDWKQSYVLN